MSQLHLTERWAPALAVVATIAIYYRLPERFALGPTWVLPALETVLLVPLLVPYVADNIEGIWRRTLSLVLISTISLGNVVSLVALISYALIRGHKATGLELLDSAIEIWVTNVIAFALWYWELDRGGPVKRAEGDPAAMDFAFPQNQAPALASPEWRPLFVDYLYVAFTNATAFSPCDTFPLTRSAKMLMLIQALASLSVLALIAGRAINILGS